MTNINNYPESEAKDLINISDPATIKNYFLKVRQLRKSGNEFPVNLDDVYPLIYSRRDTAIKKLKSEFIEDEDYILASSKTEASWGGKNKIEYLLSISAMEFFVAKKVKEVFQVYREVFHKALDEKESVSTLSQLEQLLVVVQASVQHERKIQEVVSEQATLRNKIEYLYEERQANLNDLKSLPFELKPEELPELSLRNKIRAIVNKIANNLRVQQSDVWNNVYEKLYYHHHISLKSYKKQKGEKSLLEVAERIGCLEKIFVVASNLANHVLQKNTLTVKND